MARVTPFIRRRGVRGVLGLRGALLVLLIGVFGVAVVHHLLAVAYNTSHASVDVSHAVALPTSTTLSSSSSSSSSSWRNAEPPATRETPHDTIAANATSTTVYYRCEEETIQHADVSVNGTAHRLLLLSATLRPSHWFTAHRGWDTQRVYPSAAPLAFDALVVMYAVGADGFRSDKPGLPAHTFTVLPPHRTSGCGAHRWRRRADGASMRMRPRRAFLSEHEL
jgi:hypothetical protein